MMRNFYTIIFYSTLLIFFSACDDREPDYEYNPVLNVTTNIKEKNVPIFEDDDLFFTITIIQESGTSSGTYEIRVAEESEVGKIVMTDNTVLTSSWEPITAGENALIFQAQSEGEYVLSLLIKDPFGKIESIEDIAFRVVAHSEYGPFANAYSFVRQQFIDILDHKNPTLQDIKPWEKLLATEDFDRDDLLVSFINDRTVKENLNIQAEDLRSQAKRAYITLLRTEPTVQELDDLLEGAGALAEIKTIVRRLFRSKAYEARFHVVDNLLMSDFRFETEKNNTLETAIIATLEGNLITASVPFYINRKTLVPKITIPEGASIHPDINTVQDFSKPITYTVTAADGAVQKYIVTILKEEILSEREVLLKIYELNPQSHSFLNWDLTALDMASWKGVKLTNGKVTSLDLSETHLEVIPEEISQLKQLIHLRLGGNTISVVPGTIGDLAQLRSLSLLSNRIRILPTTLGKLSRLKILDVGRNEISAIPEEIGSLRDLKSLFVYSNRLTMLPSTLANLSSLVELHASNNLFTEIPFSVFELEMLEILNFRANTLSEIPSAIENLTQLRKLTLDGNDLRILGSEIGILTALEELDISNNDLMNLPNEISNLSQLMHLNIDNNPLITIPQEICDLNIQEFIAPSGVCN